VSIAPCRIHNKSPRICPDSPSEGLGSFLDEDVTPPDLAGNRCIKWGSVLRVIAILEFRNNDFIFEARLSLRLKSFAECPHEYALIVTYKLTLDGTAVDGNVAQICEQFLGTVKALYQSEEVRGVVNELYVYLLAKWITN
jgi:hypothetical protein